MRRRHQMKQDFVAQTKCIFSEILPISLYADYILCTFDTCPLSTIELNENKNFQIYIIRFSVLYPVAPYLMLTVTLSINNNRPLTKNVLIGGFSSALIGCWR